MTTGKTIALTRQTSVGKVMSLLFNMLSRLVTGFLPRSKCLLISWLQSPSAVILETKEVKSLTVSIVSSCICHEMMGEGGILQTQLGFTGVPMETQACRKLLLSEVGREIPQGIWPMYVT